MTPRRTSGEIPESPGPGLPYTDWLGRALRPMAFLLKKTASPVLFLLVLSAIACSGDASGPGGELAPLVGGWRAEALVLTNTANSSMSLDLVEEGAVFTLSILGNGQYSASLTAFGQANVEVGTISVRGNQITITPTTPRGPATVGTWSIEGDLLVVDGDTEFDFNQDGATEAATVHLALRRVDL